MLFLVTTTASAQSSRSNSNRTSQRGGQSSRNDTAQVSPRGLKTWTIDERFGTVTATAPDTMPHLFQNVNLTDGVKGTYSHTGNIGSPRVSRIYNGQQDYMLGNQFLFTKPYDMALGSVNDCVYTNTKSPITNLTWASQGNKINGNDRFRANFASNINKDAGIGFKIDYLYGKGYYNHQMQSSLAAKIFGSYRGERYQMHAAYILDRTKNAENGGLADETYITHPEYFSTKYAPADMPVRLTSALNRLNVNTLFLTHRYNVGYYKIEKPEKSELAVAADSVVADSAQTASKETAVKPTGVFVPVAAFIHTAKFDHNKRNYIDNNMSRAFYIDDFFPENDSINDLTKYLSVENTLAMEMSEGFKPWVKTGMRLFAKHQLTRFSLPDANRNMVFDTYNYITLGAQLFHAKGDIFRYNVLGEIRTTGADWGEFNVEGNLHFNVPIRKDSVMLDVDGYVRNEEPSYYYRHYHAANAWWDNDLSNVFRSRLQGHLNWRKTHVKVAFETIQHQTFFQQMQMLDPNIVVADGEDRKEGDFTNLMYGVAVKQADKNVQVLTAILGQDFKFGPLVWENEITFQQSSDDTVLPLPKLNVWSNLYFHFNVAKVLYTDLGADVRYFTKYYGQAYVPFIGQYAVQDVDNRIKVGNYPWINVYANFHLKSCRFYVMYSHVNCSAGHYFLAPHYPTDRRTFRIGISWNFFN